MSTDHSHSEISEDSCSNVHRNLGDLSTNSTPYQFDREKRVRREIANNNERRRMQSINAGFDSLRIILPPIPDGAKMSKNEVAIYRQAAGIQTNSVLSDISSVEFSRKRKSDNSSKFPSCFTSFAGKRTDCVRSRRRCVESETTIETNCINYIHCSPESTDIHRSSPSNSLNGSISVSPTSHVESAGSTAARLEHLVMAIEQIEGGGVLHASPQPESNNSSFSVGDESPPETYWHSPQENFNEYSFSDAQNSGHDTSIKPFTDVLMLAPITDVNTLSNGLPSENTIIPTTSEDYPIVTKLLNRPIPHKYLHRPQVVVNSSH